jgi:hypothetical protein
MRLRDGLAGRLQNWGQIAFHPNPQLDLQFNRYCTSTVGNCSGRDVEKFERFGLAPPVVS